jgi:hypothetical protein
VINDIINAVIDLCESNVDLYSSISVGALPPANGISLQVGAGNPEHTFFNKGTANSISVVVNSKHNSQNTACGVLDAIHLYLTRLKSYPSGKGWQITNIETVTSPNYIGQDGNQQYLYGSIIKIKFYLKGV